LTPAARDPLIRLAYCEFRLAQYEESVRVLLKLGTGGESDVDYYLLLGSAQALAGDLPGAVSSLQRAVETSPKHPEPYYRLALVLLEGYRDRDAQEVLSRGLETIPDSGLLLFAMGFVKQVDGQYQEALVYTQKSLDRDPSRPEVWAICGELYLSLGQYDQALKAYQTAIGLGAAPEEKIKYAGLLIRLQRYKQAEKTLRELMRDGSSVEKAYEGLGRLYYAQKLYPQAQTVLRQAVRLEPGDSEAHALLAQTLQHLGQEEEARREAALAAQKKVGLRTGPLLRRVLIPVPQGADSN
jgi:tetratricopeptide (TPR) repeat protein